MANFMYALEAERLKKYKKNSGNEKINQRRRKECYR
jgi:hypothetical protein